MVVIVERIARIKTRPSFITRSKNMSSSIAPLGDGIDRKASNIEIRGATSISRVNIRHEVPSNSKEDAYSQI